jgi:hypothetical protein
MKKLLLTLSVLVVSVLSAMGQHKIVLPDIDSVYFATYGFHRPDNSSPPNLNVSLVEKEFSKLYMEYSSKLNKQSKLDSTLEPAVTFHTEYLRKNFLKLFDFELIDAKTNKENPHYEKEKKYFDINDRVNNVSGVYSFYYGEIIEFVHLPTYKHEFSNKEYVKITEKDVAKIMFNNFLKSPSHKKIMDNPKSENFYPRVAQEGFNFVVVVDFVGGF